MFPPYPQWQSESERSPDLEKIQSLDAITKSFESLSATEKPKKSYTISSRDLILGLADGLTVPFALTAGLSALGSSHLVVIGGLAELCSGAISMGVGGYLSTRADRDNYNYLLKQTKKRLGDSSPLAFEGEIYDIFSPYGLQHEDTIRIIRTLEASRTVGAKDKTDTVASFILKFGEGVEPISTWTVYCSAITIGLSYFIGGIIPMIPYFFIESATKALFVSVGITGVVLLAFGVLKGYLTGSRRTWSWLLISALETLGIGALAAGASYVIVRLVNKTDDDGNSSLCST